MIWDFMFDSIVLDLVYWLNVEWLVVVKFCVILFVVLLVQFSVQGIVDCQFVEVVDGVVFLILLLYKDDLEGMCVLFFGLGV